MFGLEYNTLLVVAGTGLLGIVAGVVGAFAVLRRRALMGDALSHAALPGLCIAFMILQERNFAAMLIGAAMTGMLGVFCVTWLRHNTRIKEDSAIGIVLSVFFGMGTVLSRIIQSQSNGTQSGLDSYLLGQTASMVRQDLYSIIVVCSVCLAVVAIFYKEFKALSFDREFTAVLGWPVLFIDIMMMLLLVITTIIGLPAVGVVLMAALLIIPAVSARMWTERLNKLLLLSAIFGLLTGVGGTIASTLLHDMPAGPVIVLAGTAIFLFSVLFAPGRGVFSRALELMRLRAKVARQNLLRSVYELNEPALPALRPFSLAELTSHRVFSTRQATGLIGAALRAGNLERSGEGRWKLTPRGMNAAVQVVRGHRLWERFLIEFADVAPDHVDRDADEMEHVLSPEIVQRLEHSLKETGHWPADAVGDVLKSAHNIQPEKR